MNFAYLKYSLPYRRRLQAQGKTVLGRPRINQSRPALRGLQGNKYHRAYMRLRRAAGILPADQKANTSGQMPEARS